MHWIAACYLPATNATQYKHYELFQLKKNKFKSLELQNSCILVHEWRVLLANSKKLFLTLNVKVLNLDPEVDGSIVQWRNNCTTLKTFELHFYLFNSNLNSFVPAVNFLRVIQLGSSWQIKFILNKLKVNSGEIYWW